MSRLWLAVMAAVVAGVGPGCASKAAVKPVAAPRLVVLTEENPPLSFERNGEPAGLAVDVVKEIMRRRGEAAPIKIMAWDKGYGMAQTAPDTALFSMIRTAERNQKFQWVGPIARVETAFYARKGSTLKVASMDDAKKARAVAVVKDDSREQLLRGQGFKNLVLCPSYEDAARRLVSGEADLMPNDDLTMPALLKGLCVDGETVFKAHVFATDLMYVAFSKSTPEAVARGWQETLDAMKRDGTFGRIYGAWLPGETPPGVLQLVTENYPPITFEKDGQVTGLATEVVRELMKRVGCNEPIRLTAWGDAYQMAIVNPNVALFSTTRTEKREKLFHWIGPIGSYRDALYARKGSGLKLAALDDAKKVGKIGAVRGWFSEEMLRAKGFKNLDVAASPVESAKNLLSGKVELCAFTDMTAPDILRQAGGSMDDLERALVIKDYEFYVTLSLGTPPETVKAWQDAFNAMKADGTVGKIGRRWIPE